MVEKIRIKNFKSLRDLTIEDCRRVNLLVGRPNVGKSNILEALALFSVPYLRAVKNPSILRLLRLGHLPELFFDGTMTKAIEVVIDNSIHYIYPLWFTISLALKIISSLSLRIAHTSLIL